MSGKDDNKRDESATDPLLGIDSPMEWDDALAQWDRRFLETSGEDDSDRTTPGSSRELIALGARGQSAELEDGLAEERVAEEEDAEALGELLGVATERLPEASPARLPGASPAQVSSEDADSDVLGTLEQAFDRLLLAELDQAVLPEHPPGPLLADRQPEVDALADPKQAAPGPVDANMPEDAHANVRSGSGVQHPALEIFGEIAAEPVADFPAARGTGPVAPIPGSAAPLPPTLFEGIEEEAKREERMPPRLPELGEAVEVVDLSELEQIASVEPLIADATYWERLEGALAIEASGATSSVAAAELELAAALAAEMQGKRDVAAARYRDVLAHRPKDLGALLALWRMGAHAGDGEESDPLTRVVGMLRAPARQRLASFLADRMVFGEHGKERAGELLGELRDTPRALLSSLLLAVVARDEPRKAEVLQGLSACLPAEEPLYGALKLALGWSLEARGEYELAYRNYRAAVAGSASRIEGGAVPDGEVQTGQSAALEGALRTALKLGAKRDAIACLERIGEGGGPWAARALERAWWLASLDDPAGESTAIERAVALAPDAPDLLQELVDELLKRGDLISAGTVATRIPPLLADSAERVEAHLFAAELLAWSGRAADAFVEIDRAEAILPGYGPTRQVHARVALWQGDPLERRDAYRRIALEQDSESRAAMHAQASHAARAAGDLESELEELEAGLKAAPSHPVLLERYELRCREARAPERLAAAFDAAAQVSPSSWSSLVLRLRSAELYEGALQRHSEALDRYDEVARSASIDSSSAAAHAAFGRRRALQALDRHDDLAQALRAEARRLGAIGLVEQQAAALDGLGSLLFRRDAGAGRACFEELLAARPGDETALWQLVLSHAANTDWAAVGSLFERLADTASDDLSRACLWLRVAALREGCGEPASRARSAYEQALACFPGLEGAAEGAARNVSHAADPASLERQLLEQIDAATDPAARFVLVMLLAGVLQADDQRVATTRARLEEALALRPDSALVRRPLLTVFRYLGDLQAARALLLGKGGEISMSTPGFTRELLGELARQAADLEAAATLYQIAIDHDQTDVYASRFLQRHHAAAGRWSEVLALRLNEARSAGGSGDGAALWLDLGLLRRSIEVSSGSVPATPTQISAAVRECFDEALYRDPRSAVALQLLLQDASARDEHDRLAALYEQLASLSDRRSEMALYRTRAGELRDDDIYSYRAALQAAPDFLPGVFRLRDVALRASNWAVAYEACAAQARHSAVPEAAVRGHRLAAEIAESKLGDEEKATSHLRKLIELQGDWDHAFDRLRRSFGEQRRWSDLVELLSTSVAREQTSAERRRDLHWEIARIGQRELGDVALAKKHLRQLLEGAPEDRPALDALADLCEAEENWEEAAGLLLRAARLEDDSVSLRTLLLRLGRIYQDRLDEQESAKASLRKVAQLDPGCTEALERLSRLYLDLDGYDQALEVLQRWAQIERDPHRQVDLQLRIAKIHEDKLHDPHHAGHAFRRAMELAPADLKAIGALCGFYARQGDQRSVMIHLDTALSTMRERLRKDPYEAFAVRAMFKIFGWRRYPDGCYCAAQALEVLGGAEAEERDFLETHPIAAGAPRSVVLDEYDEIVFQSAVLGGFRQIFRLLGEALGRLHRTELRRHGLSRADRVANEQHPVRLIGDALAADMGVAEYELYIVTGEPRALIVENVEPPAILLGADLVRDATEREIQFLMGRCLWIVRKAMVLAARLHPRDLAILVSAVVRQYVPEFLAAGVELKDVQAIERQVAKVVPRRLRAELMPFALECSGGSFQPELIGAAVVHSANRAGLLACGSLPAAHRALCRAAAGGAENPEVEELLLFAVSEEYLQLRRALGLALS